MPWRSRFAKRSSTRPGLLVGAVALGAVVSVIGLAIGSSALAFAGLAVAIVGAGGFALHLIVTGRRRHEHAEGELESLVESLGRIAESLDPDQVLERTLHEAKDLFGARASLLAREDTPRTDTAALVPLHIRHEKIGALQLVRAKPLDREEIARATLLADFASRAIENARLLEEAQVREAERARLSDQLVIAEQEERRRLALFLHDGPVQSLAGIALMLDAVLHAIDEENLEAARSVLIEALERHRAAIRALRELSFNLEPVVLRDQGFTPAVQALADVPRLPLDSGRLRAPRGKRRAARGRRDRRGGRHALDRRESRAVTAAERRPPLRVPAELSVKVRGGGSRRTALPPRQARSRTRVASPRSPPRASDRTVRRRASRAESRRGCRRDRKCPLGVSRSGGKSPVRRSSRCPRSARSLRAAN